MQNFLEIGMQRAKAELSVYQLKSVKMTELIKPKILT
jgi:hypothetical protein